MPTDCPFCRIIYGDDEAHILYETGETITFLDRDPAATGHTLIVPKQHRTSVLLSETAEPVEAIHTVSDVAEALNKVLDPDGFSIFHTNGGLVGSVKHAHIHLIPRYEDDDIHVGLHRTTFNEEKAEQITKQARSYLMNV